MKITFSITAARWLIGMGLAREKLMERAFCIGKLEVMRDGG